MFIYLSRERPRYQNTQFFIYTQIETESLCLHWLYCVQNFKTTVDFVYNILKNINKYYWNLIQRNSILRR
jgi:hypothetical protein